MTILRAVLITVGFGNMLLYYDVAGAKEPSVAKAEAALRNRSYPWYDANRDGFRPLRSKNETDRSSTAHNGTRRTRGNRSRANSDRGQRNDADASSDYSGGRPLAGRRESSPFDSVSGSSVPIFQIVLWILLGLVIAVILIGLFHYLQTLQRPVQTEENDAAPAEIDLERLQALPESAQGVHDLLSAASRLASEGAFGQAMLFYYCWQLVELDKQQAIELQKGKTNRRYLGEVAQTRPELAGVFRLSTRLLKIRFLAA